jgi:O-antigen/teichoic acid export membrane protein
MKGAMILSLSMFVTRLLGLLYVIPFQRMVGPGGLALYAYAYVPYSLLVTLSTLGIPLGIAKFISKYNADGEFDTSRKIFRVGMLIMVLVGIIGFLIMWIGAPLMADRAMAGRQDLHNTKEDAVMAIRMVSFAVLIIPPMSIFRGFFQGNQDMTPTAVSQLIEQLVRIVLIIVSSFLVIRVFNGTAQTAVKVSVFAAFVAGVSSMCVLYRYWKKKKHGFDALLALSRPHPRRSIKELFKELLSYALPFAILSLSATWFQMIDTMTFNTGMLRANVDPELAEGLFGIFITALLKIVMIPVSFSIAFGQPLIPEITEKIRVRDFKGVHQTLTSAIMLTSFITIPAVIGMSMLSDPIFILLFDSGYEEMNVLGGAMFGTGAFIALFMGLNSIIAAIIQGVGRQFKSLIFLLIATLIKLIGNLVLIPLFEFHGAVFSTILAYAFCLLMNYIEIRKTTGIQTRIILKRHLSIFIFTGIMAASVWLITKVLDLFLDYTASSGAAALYVIIAVGGGVLVYVGLAIYFDLAQMLFGNKLSFNRIKARFNRKS